MAAFCFRYRLQSVAVDCGRSQSMALGLSYGAAVRRLASGHKHVFPVNRVDPRHPQ
jgi:hypothetical protein